MQCDLCGRDNILTFHHLIPKCLRNNKWFKKRYTREELGKGIMICEDDCHPELHKLISNKDLGKYYNTIKKILSHPTFSGYVKWISKR